MPMMRKLCCGLVGALMVLTLTLFLVPPIIIAIQPRAFGTTPTMEAVLDSLEEIVDTVMHVEEGLVSRTDGHRHVNATQIALVKAFAMECAEKATEPQLVAAQSANKVMSPLPSLAELESVYGAQSISSASCIRCKYNKILHDLLENQQQQGDAEKVDMCEEVGSLLWKAYARSYIRHVVRIYSRHRGNLYAIPWYGFRDAYVHGLAPLAEWWTTLRKKDKDTHVSTNLFPRGSKLALTTAAHCAGQSPTYLCPHVASNAFKMTFRSSLLNKAMDGRDLQQRTEEELVETILLPVLRAMAEKAAMSNAEYNKEHMEGDACGQC